MLKSIIISASLMTFSPLWAASPPSIPGADAPELAAVGRFPVGVQTVIFTNPGQPDLMKANLQTRVVPLHDRRLVVDISPKTPKPRKLTLKINIAVSFQSIYTLILWSFGCKKVKAEEFFSSGTHFWVLTQHKCDYFFQLWAKTFRNYEVLLFAGDLNLQFTFTVEW